jgi:hypothetical protein
MFTWICPTCGRELPLSDNECPDCAGRQKGAAAGPAPPAQPPAVAQPVSRRGLPGWLTTLIVAGGLIALGAVFFLYLPSQKQKGAPAPDVTLEKPGAAAPHPLSRHVEVVGIRITEDASNKAKVRFLVVNHSGAEIADLAGRVLLRATADKPDAPPLCVFSFKVPALGPYEAKDVNTNVQMKLRPYELPDWQFLRAELRITAP